ncbi:hypothetical protein Sste5346_001121 [Sporothrix stenoceras]|uniref:Nitrogen regulatory protein areA GATA-like domain-containing protein n=1 Tax=Sporothrix stenoceras TaxID=5173 RepID=A0ABR3ZQC4_9PEZI
MKRPAIDQLVYEHILPRPKTSDPPNFSGLLTRFLVFEVRQEVHSFYGHLDTQEAKYPGLDYCHPIHRIRLSRWPWHRRLFRAFDALRLTPSEIANLTKWEGTRWAKERYEKEQSITILDTAADDMPDYRHVRREIKVDEEQPFGMHNNMTLLDSSHPAMVYARREDECILNASTNTNFNVNANAATGSATPSSHGPRPTVVAGFDITPVEDEAMNDVESGNREDSDDSIVTQSIGLQLNERLRERVAAHNAGDTSQPLDEDWEQWLKNALETGNLNMVAQHADLPFVHSEYTSQITQTASLSSNASANLNSNLLSSGGGGGDSVGIGLAYSNAVPGQNGLEYFNTVSAHIMTSAQQGNWNDVPEPLRDILRQTVEGGASPGELPELSEGLSSDNTAAASSSPSTGRTRDRTAMFRRTYSTLRLPSQ